MQTPFQTALAFVWRRGFDSPLDGYHSTLGDTGGGTKGGVIEPTWRACVARGVVTGTLADATDAQLSAVLESECWGSVCAALPPALGFLLFNGRMMSGGYPKLFQQCLGVKGDGVIGAETLAAARAADPGTLNRALFGVHYAYLTRLMSWPEFGDGWTTRLTAARDAAAAMISPAPGGSPVLTS